MYILLHSIELIKEILESGEISSALFTSLLIYTVESKMCVGKKPIDRLKL